MNVAQTLFLEMFLRVRQFGLNHANGFPADSRGAELLDSINSVITDLEMKAGTQSDGTRTAKGATVAKNAAFELLQEQMEAIYRTARSMSAQYPLLHEELNLPRKGGLQVWLAAARGFVTKIEPLKNEFIRRGMLSTFLDDFKAQIETVEDSVDARAQKAATQINMTAAIAEDVEIGRAVVRELDAVVRNLFREEPTTIREWESISHVERTARRNGEEAPARSTPPAQG